MTGLEESHVHGRLERGDPIEEILGDLRGGVLLDTDENPEVRAKPFLRKSASFEPTRRFSENVNNAINNAAQEHELDPGMLEVFVRIESGGNPNARTGSYKGLFQLSSSEFKKYGDGDIYDPVANANAGAAKLAAEAILFEDKHGRAATPLDLYMQHQQGIAGYEAHMANPDAPAWENMASTGEGKQKGDKWAKKAIWGNIPTDVRKQFPDGVESVSSADFVEVWRNKVERFGGGTSTISAGSDGSEYAFAGPYQHLSADARNKLIREVQVSGRNRTIQEVEDGAEQIRRTGVIPMNESGETALDRAQRILTKNQFEKARMNWQSAKMEHDAMADLPSLTEFELEERLALVEPEIGDDLYAERAKVYDQLTRQVSRIREQRYEDPAASVAELSAVMIAEQGVKENLGDPEFVQRLAATRIEAQQSVGIPEGLLSPITRQEARVLLAPTKGLEGKALQEAVIKAYDEIEEQYGPYAKVAATKALEYDTRRKEAMELMGDLLESAFRGGRPTAGDVRRLELLGEADMAERALGMYTGDYVGEPMRQMPQVSEAVPSDRFTDAEPYVPSKQTTYQADPANYYRMRKPPQMAIEALKSNPKLADEFDAHYGTGMAQKIIGR